MEGVQVRGIPTLGRLADLLHGRWDPDPARPELPDAEAGAGTDAVDLADVRGQEDAKRALRDRRRRRSQPADDRAARCRQDHARAAAAGHPAAAQLRGGAGDHPGPQRGRDRDRAARHRAPLPSAAPHDLGSGPRRRRQPAAPGRGHARASRRAVPRRAAGVRPQRGRRSAPAARGGPGRDHARPAHARVPGERDRGRGLQPLPVRAPAGRLRLHLAGAGRATSAASADRCSTASTSSARSSRCRRSSSWRTREPAPPRAKYGAAWSPPASTSADGSTARGALCNGDMDGRLTRPPSRSTRRSRRACSPARDRLNLSGRGHDRVLRVARTIADLADRDVVQPGDLDEALSYRLDGVGLMAA